MVNTILDPNWTDPLPIYAWVIEHPEGLIVIDTGETARTAAPGYLPWWHLYFKLGMQASVQPGEEIGPQLQALGLPPNQVRWLVMTHLHTDHAGGLYHFPQPEILVTRTEYNQAAGWMGRMRGYLSNHWPDWFNPTLVDFQPRPVGPFNQSYPLTRAGDVHLVPTPGHTAGQMAVILETNGLCYFFAGDTTYTDQHLLDQVVDGVSLDVPVARQTLANTLNYVTQTPTVYLPSHDPNSGSRLAARKIIEPAQSVVPG